MRDGGTDREEKGGWRRPMNDVRMTDCRRPGEVRRGADEAEGRGEDVEEMKRAVQDQRR